MVCRVWVFLNDAEYRCRVARTILLHVLKFLALLFENLVDVLVFKIVPWLAQIVHFGFVIVLAKCSLRNIHIFSIGDLRPYVLRNQVVWYAHLGGRFKNSLLVMIKLSNIAMFSKFMLPYTIGNVTLLNIFLILYQVWMDLPE